MPILKSPGRVVARVRRRIRPGRADRRDGRVGLLEAATRHDLVRAAEDRERFADYAAELDPLRSTIRHAVLVCDVRPVATANALAEYLPDAAITLLDTSSTPEDPRPGKRRNVTRRTARSRAVAARILATGPRPDAILDLSSERAWSELDGLRELLFFLPAGGLFVVADAAPSAAPSRQGREPGLSAALDEIMRRPGGAPERTPAADDEQLARAIGRWTRTRTATVIVKAGEHRYKLREHAATAILQSRYGDSWGGVLHSTPPRAFASRATFAGNRDDVAARVCPPTINVPGLSLRGYRDVSAQPRQLLFDRDFYLPDTFRHPGGARLRSRALVDASPTFAVATDATPTRQVDGTRYYLDTEFPGHFGHVMGEVISRLPGYFLARETYPDLRVVASLRDTQTALPGFQREIFRAAGIADEDVELIRPGETVRFEHLVASTPHYANAGRRWITPELGETWSYLRDRLPPGRSDRPARIFISRRPGRRSCLNSDQVEEHFGAAGFEILYPDEIPYLDQVDIFAHAEVIAGFGGSGMFNMIWSRTPGLRIVIASANFTCNEYMFSSVLGDEIHCFWQEPRIARPGSGFSGESYHSDFELDFAADGARLTALLTAL